MFWPDAELDSVRGVPNKPVLCFSAVTDEEGHHLANEDESCGIFLSIGEPFSRHVSKARDITSTRISYDLFRTPLDDFRWTIDRSEFDEHIAMKKDSTLGPDGLSYGAKRCSGGLGSQFLLNAYRSHLEGGPPLVHHEMHTSFAEMHLFQAHDRQHF